MKRSIRALAWAGLLAALALAAARAGAAEPAALPADSLYQAQVHLTDQDGRSFAWADGAGQARLVSMFYTGCPYACPATIETLGQVRRSLAAQDAARLPVLIVSFDSRNDTVAALKAAAQAHDVDQAGWTLARAPEDEVRTLAALLGVRYRALPEGGFNHATVLLLLDAQGRIVARSERLGVPDPEFVAAARELLKHTP